MSLAQVDALIGWARDHGAFLHEQVEAYDDPEYGLALRVQPAHASTHLVASSDQSRSLPLKSRIVSCPFVLSLSYMNALNRFPDLQGYSPQFPAVFIEVLDPHIIGNFFLIQQYLNVEISYWGPYIRSLPQPEEAEKLGTPLYFSQSDMAWIRGTGLEAAQELQERMWKSDWERGRNILDASHGWEDWKGKWTWNLYKWAATIFSSRSFISTLIPEEVFKVPLIKGLSRNMNERDTVSSNLPEATSNPRQRVGMGYSLLNSGNPLIQPDHIVHDTFFPVLFPLVDLANHSSAARVTWFTNGNNEPKDLSIIVDSEIPSGHQIFNNYAPKSNTELLLGYGFCIPGNDEVTITFKPLGRESMAIRKLHWPCLDFHGVEATQSTFHIRAVPYARIEGETRLPEFKLFEDGCVDTLVVLIANQRERDFMTKHHHHCPERSSEAEFAGLLSRSLLKAMSVLLEQLDSILNKVTSTGEHLGTPGTSRQQVAKIYRDGQIFVLKAVMGLLQDRLDEAMSQHTICDHLDKYPLDQSKFVDMRLNIELVTLRCAFNWLQIMHPTIYGHSIKVIASELEVVASPDLDWMELTTGGWDYTLWCLWIYIILFLRLFGEQSHNDQGHVIRWIDHMLDVYNPDATFSGWPFQKFHGDADEGDTLKIIASQIGSVSFQDTLTLKSMVNKEGKENKLLNFASTIAMEEAFTVNVEMDEGTEKERVHQKVLFLKKFPDLDGLVPGRLSRLVEIEASFIC